MSLLRRAVVCVAALGVGAVTGTVLAASPVAAASCPGNAGVTVIVQFNELGGGTVAGCDPSAAGQVASGVFADAGFPLTYATSDIGFVCRVSGKPASDDCVNASQADAYWSLWTADGEGGGWTYARRGTNSLRVGDGTYLAFVWQGSATRQPPGVAATRRSAPANTPSVAPSKSKGPTRGKGSGKGSGKGTSAGQAASSSRPTAAGVPRSTPSLSSSPTPSASASATPTAGSSSTATGGATKTSSPTPTPTPTPTVDGSALPDASEITAGPPEVDTSAADRAADSGLPVWVPILVVVGLAGVGGLVVWRRRAS